MKYFVTKGQLFAALATLAAAESDMKDHVTTTDREVAEYIDEFGYPGEAFDMNDIPFG